MTEEQKKSAGKKQTFHRVGGRLNYHWVRFHWVCYKGGVFPVKASLKEFHKRSRHLPFGDHFINSNGLVS